MIDINCGIEAWLRVNNVAPVMADLRQDLYGTVPLLRVLVEATWYQHESVHQYINRQIIRMDTCASYENK